MNSLTKIKTALSYKHKIRPYPINTKYDPIILNEDNPGRILGKAIHIGFDM